MRNRSFYFMLTKLIFEKVVLTVNNGVISDSNNEELNLTPATISFHLKKLVDAGAVKSRKEQYYTIYSINNDVFNISILDILREES